jgi:hypothetical protein
MPGTIGRRLELPLDLEGWATPSGIGRRVEVRLPVGWDSRGMPGTIVGRLEVRLPVD